MEKLIFQTEAIEDFYDLKEELGRGNFAVVKRCQKKETGEEYAAKCITKKRSKTSKRGMSKDAIETEARLLLALDHDAIIKLYDVFETKLHITLIMELLTGGELFEEIAKQEFILEKDACCYTKQILDALQHMHRRNIVHLDLKPENIVLHHPGSKKVKLIDFGLAKSLEPGKEIREMMGTPEFAAPEVINYEVVGFYTDMWALGVVTYIILSGASPFLGDDDQETYKNITCCEYQFDDEYFDKITHNAKDFIEKLLVKKTKDRNTVQDCLNHPWIAMEESETSVIDTQKMRAFVARRRWKQSLKLVSTISRLKVLYRNSIPSPTSDVSGDEGDSGSEEKNGFSNHIKAKSGQLPMFTDRLDVVKTPVSSNEKVGNSDQIDNVPPEEQQKFFGGEKNESQPMVENVAENSSKVLQEVHLDQCADERGNGNSIAQLKEEAQELPEVEMTELSGNIADDVSIESSEALPSMTEKHLIENAEEDITKPRLSGHTNEEISEATAGKVYQEKKSPLKETRAMDSVVSSKMDIEDMKEIVVEPLEALCLEDIEVDAAEDRNASALCEKENPLFVVGRNITLKTDAKDVEETTTSPLGAVNELQFTLPISQDDALIDQTNVVDKRTSNVTGEETKKENNILRTTNNQDEDFVTEESAGPAFANHPLVFKIGVKSTQIVAENDVNQNPRSVTTVAESPPADTMMVIESDVIKKESVDEGGSFTITVPNSTEEQRAYTTLEGNSENGPIIRESCRSQGSIKLKVGIPKESEAETVELKEGSKTFRVTSNLTVDTGGEMVVIELLKSENNNI